MKVKKTFRVVVESHTKAVCPKCGLDQTEEVMLNRSRDTVSSTSLPLKAASMSSLSVQCSVCGFPFEVYVYASKPDVALLGITLVNETHTGYDHICKHLYPFRKSQPPIPPLPQPEETQARSLGFTPAQKDISAILMDLGQHPEKIKDVDLFALAKEAEALTQVWFDAFEVIQEAGLFHKTRNVKR